MKKRKKTKQKVQGKCCHKESVLCVFRLEIILLLALETRSRKSKVQDLREEEG